MSPGAGGAASSFCEEPLSDASGPRLGPRLGTMDGKLVCTPSERQFLCQTPPPYMQQGCFLGELLPPQSPLEQLMPRTPLEQLLPQSPAQFQAGPAILSTSPGASSGQRQCRGSGSRHAVDWKDGRRQPVPPGPVLPAPPTPGHSGVPWTPFARGPIQDHWAPTAALGLLEAAPHPDIPGAVEVPSHSEGAVPSREDRRHFGGLPAPLLIRNTFLDAKPVRSPSLDPFFEERKVRSSPPSGPPSGRLEVAMPRHMPFTPDVRGRQAGSVFSLLSALTPERQDEGHPLTGEPEQELVGSPATPELSYCEAWHPVPPLACIPPVERRPGSSSGGSAECTASSASAACSTATPGGGGERPDAAPAFGALELPSRGSALHPWGACKPCAFVFEGCNNGEECQFCHLCEAGERKRRRKEKLDARRASHKQRQASQQMAAASRDGN
mmetsp:Transcript_79058/g.235581  ORF Transcript_79058/g.235581 Transcript_79058/m.235581 type:complete len:440 (-) Transcript_79058:50-1369(-)